MKVLKLYKVWGTGIKELVLIEKAEHIHFDREAYARFYPVEIPGAWECNKILVIPAGHMAEIEDYNE